MTLGNSSTTAVYMGSTLLGPNANTTGTAANITDIASPSHGGTGVASPTGYAYGNGAGNFTFSTTIPYSALSGTPVTGVSSVFGRTGAVVATSGDYSVGQITGAAPLASPTFTGNINFPGGIWNTTGNVGVGTTNPGAKLEVNGTAKIDGILTSGNGVALTSNAAVITDSYASTGLVLPSIPASTTKTGSCHILWTANSPAYGVKFGVGMSNSPTWLTGHSVLYYGAASVKYGSFTTSQTAITDVVADTMPSDSNGLWAADLDFTLITSTNPVVVTLYGKTDYSTMQLTVNLGSECHWNP